MEIVDAIGRVKRSHEDTLQKAEFSNLLEQDYEFESITPLAIVANCWAIDGHPCERVVWRAA
jgi:hypothetical protein